MIEAVQSSEQLLVISAPQLFVNVQLPMTNSSVFQCLVVNALL
jgi:hypothetical protein